MRPSPVSFAAVVLFAMLVPSNLPSQQAASPRPAGVRIQITDRELAPLEGSGVLTLDRQGLIATVAAIPVDTAGRVVRNGRLGAVHWETSDANVVSIYDDPDGVSVRVVAQQDGRAELTATALGKTTTLPVIVGESRKRIAAADVGPKFRVARLEIVAERGNAGPEAEASAGGLRLKENGHGARLIARAFAADGTPIPLAYFPVEWASADTQVVQIYQTDGTEAQLTARQTGKTEVSATIQGVTATFGADVVAHDARVGSIEGTTVLTTAAGNVAVAKDPPALPITVKPEPKLPITVKPSGEPPTTATSVKPEEADDPDKLVEHQWQRVALPSVVASGAAEWQRVGLTGTAATGNTQWQVIRLEPVVAIGGAAR